MIELAKENASQEIRQQQNQERNSSSSSGSVSELETASISSHISTDS